MQLQYSYKVFKSKLFQVLCVNYCSRVEGASLKILLQRCRNLKCLMMQQTNLKNDNVMAAEWDKATNLTVRRNIFMDESEQLKSKCF